MPSGSAGMRFSDKNVRTNNTSSTVDSASTTDLEPCCGRSASCCKIATTLCNAVWRIFRNTVSGRLSIKSA